MAVRQYIGARYVPRYAGDWDSTKNYEPLTIVTDANGNSFTSLKDVPAGTALTDRNYWVQTSSYSAALDQLRSRVANIENTAVPFSLLPGTSDTDKMQNAFDAGTSFVLDRDVTISDIDIAKINKVWVFGSGHKINMAGTIASTTQWGEDIWFYDCVFDGSSGGNFVFDHTKIVDVRFFNCMFENFTVPVMSGDLQTILLEGCFIKNNSQYFIDASALNAVWVHGCNFEGGGGFLKTSGGAYGFSIRDSVVESSTAVAFDIAGASDFVFDGLYLEANVKDFRIRADYLGNLSIKNCHVSHLNESDVFADVYKSSPGAGQYGEISVENNALNRGIVIKCGNSSVRYRIDAFKNSVAGSLNVNPFDFTDVTTLTGAIVESSRVHSVRASITGSRASTGEWINLSDIAPIANHHMSCGALVIGSTIYDRPLPQIMGGSTRIRFFGYDTDATVDIVLFYN